MESSSWAPTPELNWGPRESRPAMPGIRGGGERPDDARGSSGGTGEQIGERAAADRPAAATTTAGAASALACTPLSLPPSSAPPPSAGRKGGDSEVRRGRRLPLSAVGAVASRFSSSL